MAQTMVIALEHLTIVHARCFQTDSFAPSELGVFLSLEPRVPLRSTLG
jgi:hypothetical protein